MSATCHVNCSQVFAVFKSCMSVHFGSVKIIVTKLRTITYHFFVAKLYK